MDEERRDDGNTQAGRTRSDRDDAGGGLRQDPGDDHHLRAVADRDVRGVEPSPRRGGQPHHDRQLRRGAPGLQGAPGVVLGQEPPGPLPDEARLATSIEAAAPARRPASPPARETPDVWSITEPRAPERTSVRSATTASHADAAPAAVAAAPSAGAGDGEPPAAGSPPGVHGAASLRDMRSATWPRSPFAASGASSASRRPTPRG